MGGRYCLRTTKGAISIGLLLYPEAPEEDRWGDKNWITVFNFTDDDADAYAMASGMVDKLNSVLDTVDSLPDYPDTMKPFASVRTTTAVSSTGSIPGTNDDEFVPWLAIDFGGPEIPGGPTLGISVYRTILSGEAMQFFAIGLDTIDDANTVASNLNRYHINI